MTRVAINGLGRIGRAALKQVIEAPDLELVAANDLAPLDNLAYLLRHDTVYGRYEREVVAEGDTLAVGGMTVRMFNEKDPERLPWDRLEVEIVLECTGVFTNRAGLEKHLKAGARRAILSAPAKEDGIDWVVFGANKPDDDARMITCASCTTNCITPVVEVLSRRIGVAKSTMTTVHAYTASQALVDSPAKKVRRGRAGAANLVPTSTGAARATTKVLPDLEGRFDGVAVRAPVPVGSIADIVLLTRRATSADEVNQILEEEARSDRYRGIMAAVREPLVSSDIIRDPHASVVDLEMTQVVDDDLVKVMAWYDNEWGYTAQMVRTAEYLARSTPAGG